MSKRKKSKSTLSLPTQVKPQPPTPSSASSDDDSVSFSPGPGGTKRSVRKDSEQRRRHMMNQYFEELVTLLSMIGDRVTPKKMDKASTLHEAVRMIRQYYDLDKCAVPLDPPQYKPGFLSRGEVMEYILDSMNSFLMFVSENGRILYCTELITSCTGHMPSRLIGQSIYDCINIEDEIIIRSLFNPPSNVEGTPIENSPIIAYPSKMFHCRFKLFSNDPAMMTTCREFSCLSYLRQWREVQEDTSPPSPGSSDNRSANQCSSCILLLGKLLNNEKPLDQPITTNDVNFQFDMRVSKEGKILEIDKQASLVLGYTSSDLAGSSFFDYIHPYHLEKVGEAIEMFVGKGIGVSQPYKFVSKNGRYLWVVSKGYLSYNPWNHKPDHILLENKILGCDEVLPEYRFKEDQQKLPEKEMNDTSEPALKKEKFMENIESTASPTITSNSHIPSLIPESIISEHPSQHPFQYTQVPSTAPHYTYASSMSVPDAAPLGTPMTSNFPTINGLTNDFDTSVNPLHDIRQELERRNQELFELQKKMFEQQKLFEQERHQFYHITNQVMNYIGNQGASTSTHPINSIINPNMAMAISTAGSMRAPVSMPQHQASVSMPQHQAPVSMPQHQAPVSMPQHQAPVSVPQHQAPVSMPQYETPTHSSMMSYMAASHPLTTQQTPHHFVASHSTQPYSSYLPMSSPMSFSVPLHTDHSTTLTSHTPFSLNSPISQHPMSSYSNIPMSGTHISQHPSMSYGNVPMTNIPQYSSMSYGPTMATHISQHTPTSYGNTIMDPHNPGGLHMSYPLNETPMSVINMSSAGGVMLANTLSNMPSRSMSNPNDIDNFFPHSSVPPSSVRTSVPDSTLFKLEQPPYSQHNHVFNAGPTQ